MLPHDSQFAALKEKLLTMSSLAASAVQNAVRALVERNDDLARQVEADDDRLDAALGDARSTHESCPDAGQVARRTVSRLVDRHLAAVRRVVD